MPAEKKDDQLEKKVIDIFSQLIINISKSDIEKDCHQLGLSQLLGLSIKSLVKTS